MSLVYLLSYFVFIICDLLIEEERAGRSSEITIPLLSLAFHQWLGFYSLTGITPWSALISRGTFMFLLWLDIQIVDTFILKYKGWKEGDPTYHLFVMPIEAFKQLFFAWAEYRKKYDLWPWRKREQPRTRMGMPQFAPKKREKKKK